MISFLPALAYWYLEENYPLRIAILGGLFLALLEITIEKLVIKKVHTISIFNFLLIIFLGFLSLLGDEGIWFKLQPFFTGVGIGIFLLIQVKRGRGILSELMQHNNKNVPEFLGPMLEKHLAILFLSYGFFMAYVALYLSTDKWVFFKTLGFYAAFALFLIGEIVYIRFKIKKMARNQLKQEVLKRY